MASVKKKNKGEISIGKACELAGLNIEHMKQELAQRGISRTSDMSLEEMKSSVEKSDVISRHHNSTDRFWRG